MSFFSNLRRVNRVYPNSHSFIGTDNINLLNSTPAGFTNVLSAPSVRQIGPDRFVPGYTLSNNQFISTADINRIMRNNDVPNIRTVFQGITIPQLDGLTRLRQMDNVPDSAFHSRQMRKNAIQQNHPSTNTRTPEGVEQALQQNPRFNQYMLGLKRAGVAVALAAGGYLIFSAATLVQDIINALNRTGGSFHVIGTDRGERSEMCLLMHRTCRMDPNTTETGVRVCDRDPLLLNDLEQLTGICRGFNYEVEGTVCRASDPSADPDSPQYVDISDLPPGQTLMCIEPYNLADLIGDLGLDGLLGQEGLIQKSKNSSTSVSDKLLPILLMLGAIVIIGLILYFLFKFVILKGVRRDNNR
jgi:hypothetical protein